MVGFHSCEFYPLSNFSAYVVQWSGEQWPTAKHAYQAEKFTDNNTDIADKIKKASSPYKAKQIAHKHKDEVNDSFYENNVTIMREICKHKLLQHDYVQEKLLQTGDRQIVEDSPTDDFWAGGFIVMEKMNSVKSGCSCEINCNPDYFTPSYGVLHWK